MSQTLPLIVLVLDTLLLFQLIEARFALLLQILITFKCLVYSSFKVFIDDLSSVFYFTTLLSLLSNYTALFTSMHSHFSSLDALRCVEVALKD